MGKCSHLDMKFHHAHRQEEFKLFECTACGSKAEYKVGERRSYRDFCLMLDAGHYESTDGPWNSALMEPCGKTVPFSGTFEARDIASDLIEQARGQLWLSLNWGDWFIEERPCDDVHYRKFEATHVTGTLPNLIYRYEAKNRSHRLPTLTRLVSDMLELEAQEEAREKPACKTCPSCGEKAAGLLEGDVCADCEKYRAIRERYASRGWSAEGKVREKRCGWCGKTESMGKGAYCSAECMRASVGVGPIDTTTNVEGPSPLRALGTTLAAMRALTSAEKGEYFDVAIGGAEESETYTAAIGTEAAKAIMGRIEPTLDGLTRKAVEGYAAKEAETARGVSGHSDPDDAAELSAGEWDEVRMFVEVGGKEHEITGLDYYTIAFDGGPAEVVGVEQPPPPEGWSHGDVRAEVTRVFPDAEIADDWTSWVLPFGLVDVTHSEVWRARIFLEGSCRALPWGKGTLTEALEGARDAFIDYLRPEGEEKRQPPVSDAVRHLGTADMPGRGTGWE